MQTSRDTKGGVEYWAGVVVSADRPEVRRVVEERSVEFDAIVELLLRCGTAGADSARLDGLARAIAAGCLGEQHLWRDLELPNRAMLRALLESYFAPFAAENVMDMRWKKFIYRKLCRWGGFNTCKAPSCAACPDYAACFGESDLDE